MSSSDRNIDLMLHKDANNYYKTVLVINEAWKWYDFPLKLVDENWTKVGTLDWSQINYIVFEIPAADTSTRSIIVDGLSFHKALKEVLTARVSMSRASTLDPSPVLKEVEWIVDTGVV